MIAVRDDVLEMLPGRPRLLGWGEPTHGEDSLLEARNELFRQMVERAGYRTIAIESDCLRGLIVDDYVRGGVGDLDEVMARGFSHGFGGSPANRELVRWMRAHNDGRAAAERVRFAGFDGPLEMAAAAGPREALVALHAYLAERVAAELLPCTADTLDRLLGDDERWTDPAATMSRSPDVGRLRLLADDLVALLDARPATDLARLHARTATGLLRYHRWLAEPSPARFDRLIGQRTAMMAANLLALTDRGPTLAHGHNNHLRHDGGVGAIVGDRLGDGYAVVATALGTARHRGIGTPPPDTLEGLLHAVPRDRFVVDPRELATAAVVPRVSPWPGYAPLDPAHLSGIDVLGYVRDAVAGPPWWPPA